METKTVLSSVHIVCDYFDYEDKETYQVHKPVVLKVDQDYLTIGGINGPDMWRGKLVDIGVTYPSLRQASLPELVEELHRRMK